MDIALMITGPVLMILGLILTVINNQYRYMLLSLPTIWFVVAISNIQIDYIEEIEPKFIGNDVLFKVNNEYRNGFKFFKRNINKDDRLLITHYKRWSYGVYFLNDEFLMKYSIKVNQ